jgi:hypothetical protein
VLEKVPALQLAQVLDEFAAIALEYAPAGQLAHLLARVQSVRNSVPYRTNSSNKTSEAELPGLSWPANLLKVNPRYRNQSDAGLIVILITLLM